MIPHKTIEEIINKHSYLEKDLASEKLIRNYLLKNLKNTLI